MPSLSVPRRSPPIPQSPSEDEVNALSRQYRLAVGCFAPPKGGIGIGIVATGLFVGPLANRYGADIGWVITAALAAILTGLSWRDFRAIHPGPSAQAASAAPGLAFPLPLLAGAYFCEGLGYIVTGTFLVAIVRQTPGLEFLANASWVLVGLAVLPSAVAWGWAAEHKGHVRTLIAAHAIQAVGVALPALIAHPVAVAAGALMYGGTFVGIVGVTISLGRVIAPAHPARTIGWLTVAFGVGQIIGPVLATWIAARGGWAPAVLTAAAVIVAGIPMLWIGSLAGRAADYSVVR